MPDFAHNPYFNPRAEEDSYKPAPKAQPEGSVGDINSTAKGSGARFNAGKAPMELIPLCLVSESYTKASAMTTEQRKAADALYCLGRWQSTGEASYLFEALRFLGLEEGWKECAEVFDYGRKKYAEWNWAKGMKWSIPLACAARHLKQIIEGETNDLESGKAHRGHVFCNIVMLLTFMETYPEGDDRPRCLVAA
jgi:hypothetical protein